MASKIPWCDVTINPYDSIPVAEEEEFDFKENGAGGGFVDESEALLPDGIGIAWQKSAETRLLMGDGHA